MKENERIVGGSNSCNYTLEKNSKITLMISSLLFLSFDFLIFLS